MQANGGFDILCAVFPAWGGNQANNKDKDKEMGWTTCFNASYWKYDRKGNRTVDRRKELDGRFTWERKSAEESFGRVYPPMKDTVLKSAMVGSVYYAAVKREKPGAEPFVWAAVCPTHGRGKDGSLWGYKDMSEDVEPFYYDCPAGILALLTPTDNANSVKWREECRRKMAKKAEERKNGPAKMFAPNGVTVTEEGRSWILTSKEYREKCHYAYMGVRFSKARWHDPDRAMAAFLMEYGSAAQKAEFAASGRECPADWKGVAA